MEFNPNIAATRNALATRHFDHGSHWRILFLGRSVNGSTDIVSCLSRSLRNLGHHVLDLDAKRHRGLVDNPTRAKGGNGPIYVNAGFLKDVLARFRPQMIVCCAGGMVFRPEDAAALKASGIVLVGLTLSDPDVFPSVHPHVGEFDFHTTNARVAMDMYRQAGVPNTLYFPFGIDRGFVTQVVPRAPELQADVICIGHATARPERNGVMTRVARDLDVRTYGRGWELPGSEVVEGRRMVQASREGRVHVNFPMTRAGYINIKCGVFESVGSGGLVATGRFGEMEDFFTYDEEILGYRDEDDLVEQARAVLADPERYRHMTERAFERLINHHLYEHRWISLFTEMQRIAAAGGSWLGARREGEIAGILSESLPRAKHVLLSGFYGASNVGDELILRSISERIQSADAAAQVWIAAENPDQVERHHGLQSFPRKSLPQALHAARTASGIVLGGGGLWHDYTFERSGGLLGLFDNPQISIAGFGALPLMARMFDAPFHVVGLGIGPLDDPDARRMAGFIGSHAESVMVRDEESLALARAILPGHHGVRQAPDVVYALKLERPAAPDEISAFRAEGYRVVGLNLRPWAHTDEDALVAEVSAALLAQAARERIAVVGIPMQAGDRLDSAVLARVARTIEASVPCFVMKAPLTTDVLVATLSSVDALVSMRLHACLLAHRLGTPVAGIAYDPKVANHFAELGRSMHCHQLPLPAGWLAGALAGVMQERDGLPAPVTATIASLEGEAAAALDEVAAKLAAAPARQVVFEVPRMMPAQNPANATVGTAAAAAARAAPGADALRFVEASRVTCGSIVDEVVSKSVAAASLAVSIPTPTPTRGDGMEVEGYLDVPIAGDVDVALSLESGYSNPKAVGRVRWTLEIGERWRLREDLALSSDPVRLHVFCKGPTRIPVRLGVYVERTCFASSAWPRLSQIKLLAGPAVPADHGCELSIVASRGSPTQVANPSAASIVATAGDRTA